jgi:hypothetical protein
MRPAIWTFIAVFLGLMCLKVKPDGDFWPLSDQHGRQIGSGPGG